ncbi:MAG: glycosyltransferase family 2 protein [Planctomycetota bacterium]
MDKRPLVSIVIPHFRTEELARLCLRSIRRFSPPEIPYELIFVDNNSGDASLDYLRSVGWIRLVERPEVPDGGAGGIPHGEAMDLGMETARGTYLLSMHTDTIVLKEGWLRYLLDHIESDEQVAAVGSYKLERKNPFLLFFKRITDVHALKEWFRRDVLKQEIKKRRVYIRSHCALYRLDLLKKLGLSFQMRGQLTSGEHIYIRLVEEGFKTVLLPARQLMRFMVHLAHGTRLFNPGEKTQGKTLKVARRRWDKVLGLPDAREILADDSLDR